MAPVLPIDVKLIMSKIAIGAPLIGGEFTFRIFNEVNNPIYTATNNAQGLITFPAVHFSMPGEYNYKIRETDGPDEPNWDLDDTEWPVRIYVYEDDLHHLHATVTYPFGMPIFINKHKGETCGLFEFPELTFDEEGTYEYTLKELTPSGDGWVTDDNVIHIEVDVIEDGHGNLVATIRYLDGFPSFKNIFNGAPARIVISGCKIAIGAPLPAGKFEFGLFDKEGELIYITTNGPAEETKPTDPDEEDENEQ